MLRFLAAWWFYIFPRKMDPLYGEEEPYAVDPNATPQALNAADMARLQVKAGGTAPKLNFKRSDPRHPKYRSSEHGKDIEN